MNNTAFDWALFDAQPVAIKRLMWEHAIEVDFPVMAANANAVARRLLAKRANNMSRSKRVPRPDFSRFVPNREAGAHA